MSHAPALNTRLRFLEILLTATRDRASVAGPLGSASVWHRLNLVQRELEILLGPAAGSSSARQGDSMILHRFWQSCEASICLGYLPARKKNSRRRAVADDVNAPLLVQASSSALSNTYLEEQLLPSAKLACVLESEAELQVLAGELRELERMEHDNVVASGQLKGMQTRHLWWHMCNLTAYTQVVTSLQLQLVQVGKAATPLALDAEARENRTNELLRRYNQQVSAAHALESSFVKSRS